jgi:hypothetical protein
LPDIPVKGIEKTLTNLAGGRIYISLQVYSCSKNGINMKERKSIMHLDGVFVLLAAARAISSMVDEKKLCEDYIIPNIFDRKVVAAVTSAVSDAAHMTGVARKER